MKQAKAAMVFRTNIALSRRMARFERHFDTSRSVRTFQIASIALKHTVCFEEDQPKKRAGLLILKTLGLTRDQNLKRRG